jgi:hypothetical protein
MLNDRYRLLLVLALVLESIRFILLPWIDWQDQRIEELRILTDRLERSVSVQQNRDVILKAQQTLDLELSKIRRVFPNFAKAADYRLDAQQKLSELATQNAVVMQSHEWVLEREVADSSVRCFRWRASFSGSARNIAAFQGGLEANNLNLIPIEFVLNPSGPLTGADSPVSLAVTADSCSNVEGV